MVGDISPNGRQTGFPQEQNRRRFLASARKPAKMFRVGLYARVSTHDQQTLPLQIRAMREYAARRGWTIAIQIREVGSGAVERELARNCWMLRAVARSMWCWSGGWIAGAAH